MSVLLCSKFQENSANCSQVSKKYSHLHAIRNILLLLQLHKLSSFLIQETFFSIFVGGNLSTDDARSSSRHANSAQSHVMQSIEPVAPSIFSRPIEPDSTLFPRTAEYALLIPSPSNRFSRLPPAHINSNTRDGRLNVDQSGPSIRAIV